MRPNRASETRLALLLPRVPDGRAGARQPDGVDFQYAGCHRGNAGRAISECSQGILKIRAAALSASDTGTFVTIERSGDVGFGNSVGDQISRLPW